jgi:predicted amidohydrolase YtcJ
MMLPTHLHPLSLGQEGVELNLGRFHPFLQATKALRESRNLPSSYGYLTDL